MHTRNMLLDIALGRDIVRILAGRELKERDMQKIILMSS
jgi:hypothetical protein